MSDSLDKLFRDRELSVPPTTPPPGQWALIRDRQPALKTGNKRPLLFWGLVLGLLLGLGVGVPAGAYFLGTECPAVTNGEEVYAASVSGKVNGGLGMAADSLASSTSLAPAAAPKNSPAPVSLTSPDQANYTTRSATADELSALPPVKQTESFPAHTEIAGDVPLLPDSTDGLGGRAGDDQLETNNGLLRATAIPNLPQIEAGTVASARFGSLQSTLVSAAARTLTSPVKIKKGKSVSLARWETGLHLTPRLSNSSVFVEKYSVMDNGGGANEFVFGDRDVTLYRESSTNLDINRRAQVKIINFEVARQFRNGVRLGLGLTWNRGRGGLQDHQRYLNPELEAEEWAVFYTGTSQGIHAIVQLDYTFMRRRRFRPYLGLSLRGQFFRDYNFQTFLFERESGRSEEVDAFSTFGGVRINYRSLIPRTGFQYDLTNRLSIGTEVNLLGDVSIGGRWKW